jgi:hypothetical protein
MKLLSYWLLHTWKGLAGLLGGFLGSWQADGAAVGFGLSPLRALVSNGLEDNAAK